jgi:hypothetical protein
MRRRWHIGTLRAAHAAADGCTILSGHLGTNALASAFYPNLGYDPLRDFEPMIPFTALLRA